MTPDETINILRQLHEWLKDETQWAPTMGAKAVKTAIKMIERLEATERKRDWHAERCEDAMNECTALLAKIEAAEKEREIDERRIADLMEELNRVGHENDALRAAVCHEADCVEACKAEVETLRAKITEMEKQKPIGTAGGMPGTTGFTMACFHADKVPIGDKLYALPGAKGEEK